LVSIVYIYLATISSRPRPPCSCTRPYITYFISFFFLKKVGDIHYKFRRTWFVIITYIIPLSVWSLRQTTPLIKTNYRANSTNTYDQDRQTKPKLKIKYQLDEAIQNWQTGLANDTSNKSNIHIKGNNMKMKTPVIFIFYH
jgi:hypothetical protein